MAKVTEGQSNARISKGVTELIDGKNYSVVVVGSGYGGSIAASRMARAGQDVCLLERGHEIRPGEYPSSLGEVTDQTQIRTDSNPGSPQGKPTALFDLRVNEDVSALVGCGLGGTSLINANVSLQLNEAVFKRDGLEWPKEFRDQPDLLKKYYQLAREGLGANPYPQPDDKDAQGYKPLNKLLALEKSAIALGVEVTRPDINVTFNQDKANHFGFRQAKCNLCGDCCSGCNVGAKNTTLMNYLPDANAHGAELFCNASVKYIEKAAEGWIIHIRPTEGSRKTKKSKTIKAKVLILASGTLGSTEIMLRSKAKGLLCSNKLGQHFSGNGDQLAFGYNSYWKDNNEHSDPLLREDGAPRYESIYSVGMGDNELSEIQMPGPCITGVIDLRNDSRSINDQLVIQEGVAPGAFASVVLGGLVFGAAGNANFLRYGAAQAETRLRDIQTVATAVQDDPASLSSLAYEGAISRTQNYLMMSMDKSAGELKLKQDTAVIHWPDAGKGDDIKSHHNTIARVNDAIQGQLIKNPLWGDAFGNKLITVHPLGGCRMADDHHSGVVNHSSQVFDCGDDDSVYDGLYICDGSVLPGAIGVNPLLTISALAERCCELIAEQRGWNIDYQSKAKSSNTPSYSTTSVGQSEQSAELAISPVLADEIAQLADQVAQPEEVQMGANSSRTKRSEDKKKLRRLLSQAATTLLDLHDEKLITTFDFSESMRGYVDQSNNHRAQTVLTKRDYQRAYAGGRSVENSLQLKMTIQIPDLHQLIKDRHYRCDVKQGEVILANQSLPINSGTFQLLVPDSDAIESWIMLYELDFEDQNGTQLKLVGRKTLHSAEGSHWWTDLSTLNVDIFTADKRLPKRLYSGIAELTLQDLIKMVSTFEAKLGDGVMRKLLGNNIYRLVKLTGNAGAIKSSIGTYYLTKLAASLGETVFRAYGGLLSTLNNYPNKDLAQYVPPLRLTPEEFPLIKTADGSTIKLTCYRSKTQNSIKAAHSHLPVILAPGMGVKASSFAAETVDCNLVEFLTRQGREVWLFDYRASADSGVSHRPFTIGDIAQYDWPAAIDFVAKHSEISQVQIVAHCVGSLSLLMSLLKEFISKDQIRSIVSSQLTLHPVTNWLNNAKADLGVIEQLKSIPLISQMGNVLDMNSGTTGFDRIFDVMAYQIPTPKGEECNNPVCHRILAAYGPSYLHSQLNHATHLKLADWFSTINLDSFRQLTHMIRAGHVVDADGKNSYLAGIARADSHTPAENTIDQLDLPITFMAGALNLEFLPQTSARTYEWLRAHNSLSEHKYHRHVFEHYGHMDCFIGKNASIDIFPKIYSWLEKHD
ncbi:MAG: GMC family oxidoreductase [Arenicella sp.]|nr:GMC family oxidoreductase [Arenicella sp.]